jgi:hypothetical protein
MGAKRVIQKFGGQSALAALIGKGPSTVAYWAKTGQIPAKWQPTLLELAVKNGIELTASDFIPGMAVEGAEFENIPRTKNAMPIKVLVPAGGQNPRNPNQIELPLQIKKQIEIDGIGMGVLSDGTAFLNGRGLARLCGIDSSRISEMSADWDAEALPITVAVKGILKARGVPPLIRPYYEITQRSGFFHAFSDVLCLAVLEYYAFDAPTKREEAQKNFRLLAGKALHDFIYTQVGYDPGGGVPDAWKQFHDRVSLTYNSIPAGYFGIFKEMSDMIVTLGQAGAFIDEKFVPDISVGIHWGKFWTACDGDKKFGPRVKYEHNYPSYFPQADSNPQEPWCYPDSALGEFRRWLREDYIGKGKFSAYLTTKVEQKQLPASFAQLAISAYQGDDG